MSLNVYQHQRHESRFFLGRDVYLTISVFRGKMNVGIRKFKTITCPDASSRCKIIPTRNGITLSREQMNQLRLNLPLIMSDMEFMDMDRFLEENKKTNGVVGDSKQRFDIDPKKAKDPFVQPETILVCHQKTTPSAKRSADSGQKDPEILKNRRYFPNLRRSVDITSGRTDPRKPKNQERKKKKSA